jgi:hypothetical protein
MVLTGLLAFWVAANGSTAKIVSASLFKNGYAIVTREIEAPGPGAYSLSTIPDSSIGTLWFSTTPGLQLDSVQTVASKTNVTVPAQNLDGILHANLGKTLRFGLDSPDGLVGPGFMGKLLSADGELVIVQTDTNSVSLQRSRIRSIGTVDASQALLYSTEVSTNSRSLEFKVSGKAGKIRMVSLERGLSWAPGYAVELQGNHKLALTAKATIVNDLEDLGDVDIRFITGFPNIPYAQYLDPLISGQNVDGFVNLMKSVGGPAEADRSGLMTQNGVNRADFSGMTPTGSAEGSKEDLFFYKQPHVSLAKSARGYYVLFRSEAPYDEIYTWDVSPAVSPRFPGDVPMPNEVWHALQFKNSSGQPLTTGIATTFQGGEIVGQDQMNYAPVGAQVELRINKALDIKTASEESEVSRIRAAVKSSSGVPLFDEVTLRGTLQIMNPKPETIKLRIVKEVFGEVVSADLSPTITKTTQGLNQLNPYSRMLWNIPVEPGKTVKIAYTYTTYAASNGGRFGG